MNHLMRTRTVRLLGVLFGLSMVLTACDAQDVLALLEGSAAAQAPAEAAGDEGARDAVDRRDRAPARADEAPARQKASRPSASKDAASSGGDGAPSRTLSGIERDIADRLNVTRREAGLKALTVNAEISRGARSWSCDMAVSGNFRHADLRAAGVYGENIAWGQRSAAEVHQGWMNSPGHRDNRMSSRWSAYGVGVCEDGGGNLYFTERFR